MAGLSDITVATAALSGEIYIGRKSKRTPRTFSSKRHATAEAMEAVVRHMLHDMPNGSSQMVSFDEGETWFEIIVKPKTKAEATDDRS